MRQTLCAYQPIITNGFFVLSLPWSLLMVQEYRVFGLTRTGDDPEEGEDEKIEKVGGLASFQASTLNDKSWA